MFATMIEDHTATRGAREGRRIGGGGILLACLLLAACPGKDEAVAPPIEGDTVPETPEARRMPLPKVLSGGLKPFTFDLGPYGSGVLTFDAKIQDATTVSEKRERSPSGALHVVHTEQGQVTSERWLVGDRLYERVRERCRVITGPQARAEAADLAETPVGNLILSSPLALLTEGIAQDATTEIGARHWRFHVDTVDRANQVTADGSIRVDEEGRPLESEGDIALDLIGVAGARSTAHWTFEVSHVGEPVAVTLPDACARAAAPSADLSVVPRPADAQLLWSMPESLAYVTAGDVKDVVAFYGKAMQAEGWQEVKADQADGAAALRFHRRDQMVIVSVSKDARGARVVLTSRD